mgnify:CR=1 FL=1
MRFNQRGDRFWQAIYAIGRPVQYAHLGGDLALWHTQNVYAGRPWAVELPSAGHPLRWSLLAALRSRGVTIARVTHAAGLSATGDDALDAQLRGRAVAQASARLRARVCSVTHGLTG